MKGSSPGEGSVAGSAGPKVAASAGGRTPSRRRSRLSRGRVEYWLDPHDLDLDHPFFEGCVGKAVQRASNTETSNSIEAVSNKQDSPF